MHCRAAAYDDCFYAIEYVGGEVGRDSVFVGGGCSFVVCLSHLPVDHACPLSTVGRGCTVLLLGFWLVKWPLTARPFRDGAPFLLLLETPPTFGRSVHFFHVKHAKRLAHLFSLSFLLPIRFGGGGGCTRYSCMAVSYDHSGMTLASLQCREGACRAFTNQADIACTKREAP